MPPLYIDFPVVAIISHRSPVPTLTNVSFVPPGMDTETDATGIFLCNSSPYEQGLVVVELDGPQSALLTRPPRRGRHRGAYRFALVHGVGRCASGNPPPWSRVAMRQDGMRLGVQNGIHVN